jgi:lipoate---protein ligase
MTDFRLLQTGHKSAAFNMALDEVLVNRVRSGQSKPSLRLYGWQPAAVSIGYFQSLEVEVDTKRCEELNIDVVRRQTGGGAVFHDDEVTYSMHIPLELGLVPVKVLDSYSRICQGIIKGLAPLDIEAQFVPLNDIIANGKKISGNAQTRKQGVLLQHGTILTGVDVDKMFDLLKVPDEKMKGKLISSIKERVTSIAQLTGTEVVYQDIVDTLVAGFKEEFSEINFVEDEMTAEEIDETEKLATNKYGAHDWNYQR